MDDAGLNRRRTMPKALRLMLTSKSNRQRGLRVLGVVALVVVIAPVSVCSAIDLTVFRPSYAHVTTGDLWLYTTGTLEASLDSASPGGSSSMELAPGANWLTKTSSDSRDLYIRDELWFNWGRQQQSYRTPATGHDYLSLEDGLEMDWNEYLGRSDFLVSLKASAMADPGAEFLKDTGLAEADLRADGSASVGIGYGRFRDAWPLLKAIRLAGVLKDDGVLDHEPREGELLELADFISRSWKLFYIHDRAAKFYYDSLAARLLSTGLVREPLPAYELMHLDDALAVGSDERDFGSQIVAGLGAGAQGDLYYWAARSADSSHWDRSGRVIWVPFVGYRYARPYGTRWTTNADVADRAFVSGDTLNHSATVQFQVAYNITNRFQAQAELDVGVTGRSVLSPFSNSIRDGSGTVSGGFAYYLSDRLHVSANAGIEYLRPSDDSHAAPRTKFFCGLSLSAGPQWSLSSNRALSLK